MPCSVCRPQNRYWHLRVITNGLGRIEVWADMDEASITTPESRFTWVKLFDYTDPAPLSAGAVGFGSGGDTNSW